MAMKESEMERHKVFRKGATRRHWLRDRNLDHCTTRAGNVEAP